MFRFKNMILGFVMSIFLISLISAIPSFYVKENTFYDLKISCENQGDFCSGSTTCNLTLNNPNSGIFVENKGMTNLNNGYFNYSLSPDQTTPLGEFGGRASCTNGSLSDTTIFTYEVTSTGIKNISILDHPLLIFLSVLALVFVIAGIYFSNPFFGFIGSIMFLLLGIYVMIYGLNNITNFYTRGAAISIIGLGLIFMFASAYEWLSWGGSNDDDD